jgi:hypothetical protein
VPLTCTCRLQSSCIQVVEALSLFVHDMAFAIAKGPKHVAFNKQRMKDFAVPCVRLIFDRWVVAVHVGLLERIPGGDNMAPQKVAPADGGLVDGKLEVH